MNPQSVWDKPSSGDPLPFAVTEEAWTGYMMWVDNMNLTVNFRDLLSQMFYICCAKKQN